MMDHHCPWINNCVSWERKKLVNKASNKCQNRLAYITSGILFCSCVLSKSVNDHFANSDLFFRAWLSIGCWVAAILGYHRFLDTFKYHSEVRICANETSICLPCPLK